MTLLSFPRISRLIRTWLALSSMSTILSCVKPPNTWIFVLPKYHFSPNHLNFWDYKSFKGYKFCLLTLLCHCILYSLISCWYGTVEWWHQCPAVLHALLQTPRCQMSPDFPRLRIINYSSLLFSLEFTFSWFACKTMPSHNELCIFISSLRLFSHFSQSPIKKSLYFVEPAASFST